MLRGWKSARIVVCSDTYYPATDGVARFAEHLVRQLVNHKYQVDFLLPRMPRRKKTYELIPGANFIPHRCFPIDWASYYLVYPSIKQLKAIKQADVVIINTPGILGISTFFLAKTFKKPVIWFVHHDEKELIKHTMKFEGTPFKLLMMLGQYMYQNTQYFAYATRKFYLKSLKFGIKPEQLFKVNFGIPKMHNKKAIRTQVIEYLNLQEGERLVIYVGRMSEEKNIPTILKSLTELHRPGKVKCVMIGAGHLLEQVLSEVDSLPLEQQIYVTGRVDDQALAVYYDLADVFLTPTIHESLSFTILEAMHFRTIPVVNNRFRELPLDDRNSLGINDIYSVDEIVSGVRSLLADPDEMYAMQESAHGITKELSWDSFGSIWDEKIQFVLEKFTEF